MRVTVSLIAASYSGLEDEGQCKASNVEAGRGAASTRLDVSYQQAVLGPLQSLWWPLVAIAGGLHQLAKLPSSLCIGGCRGPRCRERLHHASSHQFG